MLSSALLMDLGMVSFPEHTSPFLNTHHIVLYDLLNFPPSMGPYVSPCAIIHCCSSCSTSLKNTGCESKWTQDHCFLGRAMLSIASWLYPPWHSLRDHPGPGTSWHIYKWVVMTRNRPWEQLSDRTGAQSKKLWLVLYELCNLGKSLCFSESQQFISKMGDGE